jgi:hypothetical protein
MCTSMDPQGPTEEENVESQSSVYNKGPPHPLYHSIYEPPKHYPRNDDDPSNADDIVQHSPDQTTTPPASHCQSPNDGP